MPRRACQFTGSGQIRLLVMTLYFLMVFSPAIVVSLAQVTTSITSTTGVGSLRTDISTSGAHTTIMGGTHQGQNLFHSFGTFSVAEGHLAEFVNDKGPGIINILSRVTGDNASNIYGTIKTTNFDNAAFWLFNPHGIVVGPGATFDIKGPINLSTANYLQFVEKRFNAANEPLDATLRVNPTAWGFLGAAPTSGSTIQVNGGTVRNASTLTLVGRDVVDGSRKTTAPGILLTGGTLVNPGGSVKLASVGTLANGSSSAEVAVDNRIPTTGFAQLGSVRMTGGAGIDVSADKGGAIFIRANHLVMEAGSTLVNETTSGKSGGVTIDLTGDFTLDDHSYVYSPSFGKGDGGTIDVTADRVSLKSGSFFYAPTFGTGAGGSLNLKMDRLQAIDSFLYTGGFRFDFHDPPSQNMPDTMGVGKAGSIAIEGKQGGAASLVDLKNTIVYAVGNGTQGGDVSITAQNVHLTNGTTIQADTTGRIGAAGNITVRTERFLANVDVDPKYDQAPFSRKLLQNVSDVKISSNTKGSGKAGTVTIEEVSADRPLTELTMANTRVTTEAGASNETTGAGGAILLKAPAGTVRLDRTVLRATVGQGSDSQEGSSSANITVIAKDLKMTGGGIVAQTLGKRNAGNITLNVGTLTTEGSDTPVAGVVDVKGVVDENGVVRTKDDQRTHVVFSSTSKGTGNAGIITIRGLDSKARVPGPISLSGTNIFSRATKTGEGGTIDIASNQAITLTDVFLNTSVKNGTDTNNTIRPTITLATPDLRIVGRAVTNTPAQEGNPDRQGGQILAGTLGSRNAGDIILNARQLTIDEHPVTKIGVTISSSSSNSTATGNAGKVIISGMNGDEVPGTISLKGSTITTDAKGTGEGGPITIQSAGDITLTDTVLSANVNNVSGNSQGVPTGNILVTTPKQLSITGGWITAQTTGSRHAGSIALKVGSLITAKGKGPDFFPHRPFEPDRVVISSSSTGRDFDEKTGIFKTPATGNAGTITIGGVNSDVVPGSISLSDTNISTGAKGTGAGGQITIRSSSPMTMTQSTLSANVNNVGSDQSVANIELTTPRLTMTGGGIIAQTSGSRGAANIMLKVGSLTTAKGTAEGMDTNPSQTNRVVISSSSTGLDTDGDGSVLGPKDQLATGNAGTITILGQNGVDPVSGAISLLDTNVVSRAIHTGEGGTITMKSNQAITLKDVFLSTSVNRLPSGAQNDSKNLPTITLTTPDLRISGRDVNSRKDDKPNELNNDQHGGQILAETTGSRDAGNIILNVGQLTIDRHPVTNNGVIISGTSSGTGLDEKTGILHFPATGNAGTITILGLDGKAPVPGTISLTGATIQTEARGTGKGGTITIHSAADMTLTDTVLSADVTNGTDSGGVPTGNITVTTPKHLSLAGGGITAQTTGSRHAGNITLSVGGLTTGKGSGGIEFVKGQPTDRVVISSSSTGVTTQDGQTDGNAGNITIGGPRPASFPTTLTLADTTIETDAQENGGGGTIVLGATGSTPVQMTRSIVSARVNEAGGTADLGSVRLTTGAFQIVDSTINVETIGSRNAGQLNVLFDTLSMRNSHMISQSTREGADSTAGAGGSIQLKGTTIDLLEGSSLVASVKGGSNSGGNIDVTAPTVNIAGSTVTSTTDGKGSGGTITLRTDNFSLVGQSKLTTTSGASASGPAGNVTIEGLAGGPISGSLRLENSQIKTNAEGTGAGGLITVNSGIPVTLITGVDFLASVKGGESSTNDPSSGITVTAPSLTMLGGELKAETNGTRNGGTITLTTQALTLDQNPTTGSPTIISTSSAGAGHAGNIVLTATSTPPLSPVTSSASVTVASPIQSLAASGTSTPGSILVTGKSQVLTSSSGSGFGGNITMNAQNITLTNSAKVSASNANVVGGAGATGGAGSITMTAANQYRQSGGALVTTETQGVATNKLPGAGNIQIVAGGDAFLLENAAILANSKNETRPNAGDNLRDAGTISLTAGRDIQMRNATIATEADAALGGSITLRSPSFFHAHASQISSSVQGTTGSNGGNIFITDQRFQLIEGTQILARANQGRGGEISLSASGAILVDPSSRIDASSARGAQFSGRVDVQAPVKVLSGTIVPVRPFFTQVALSTDRCSADPAGKFSSFTQGKRDGLPQEPGRFVTSPLTLEQLEAPGHVSSLALSTLTARRFNVPMLSLSPQLHLALSPAGGCGRV